MTSDTYLPRLGGGEYHVFYLRRELLRLGHHVILLTTEPMSFADTEADVHRLLYRGLRSFLPLAMKLWRLSAGTNVVHSHNSYRIAFLAGVIARLRRKPFVVTQHGMGLLPQVGETFLGGLAFRIWRYWSMRIASKIISTSEDLSVDIRSLGFGDKIVAISNGYDAERFVPLPPPTSPEPLFLAVRRLVPKTGIQFLLQAMPMLRRRIPGVHLEIVGDGRFRPYLEERARELGVASSVTFTGPLPHEALLDEYRKAHVVLIPSTAESTSLACIEAMALGKVIVASRVGGLIELLGKHGERGTLVSITKSEHCTYDAPLELSTDKVRCLADAIGNALDHRDEAEVRARRAAEYARAHFAWTMIVKRTVDEVYLPVAASSIIRA